LWFGPLTTRARLCWRAAAWATLVLSFVAGMALAVQRSTAVAVTMTTEISVQPATQDAVTAALAERGPDVASATGGGTPAQTAVTCTVLLASTLALFLATALAWESGPVALIRLLALGQFATLLGLSVLALVLATLGDRICGASYGFGAPALELGQRIAISFIRPVVTAARAVHAREVALGAAGSIPRLALTAWALDVQIPEAGIRDAELQPTPHPEKDDAASVGNTQERTIGGGSPAMWSPFPPTDRSTTPDERSA
jgi:hypothetical protein